MQLAKPFEHRRKPSLALRKRQDMPSFFLQISTQCPARQILFHQIGRPVLLKKIKHTADTRQIEHPVNPRRFFPEPPPSFCKLCLISFQWTETSVHLTSAHSDRCVLLDRDQMLQHQIHCQISDAEAAAPEHTLNLIFFFSDAVFRHVWHFCILRVISLF